MTNLLILIFIMQWKSFLNSSKIYSIAKFGDTLLLGTNGGVLFFDKRSCKFITQITNVDGLASNNVVKVEVDKDNNFWFLCKGGGISLMSKAGIRNFYSMDGLPSYSFSSLFVDGDSVWVGTDDDKKVWLYNIKTDRAKLLEIKPSNEVNDIKIIENKIWFATNKGIGVLTKGDTNFIIYDKQDGLPTDTILSISRWKNYILAGGNKGIAIFDSITWHTIDSSFDYLIIRTNPPDTDTVWTKTYEFYPTNEVVYAARSNGVWKCEDATFNKILEFNSRSVIFNEVLWIGTYGAGLVKYNGNVTNYIHKGPSTNYFEDIAVDLKGNVWSAHGGPEAKNGTKEVSKLVIDDENWVLYNKNNEWGECGGGPYRIVVDNENNKWIGMYDWTNNLGLVKILPNDSIVKIKIEGGEHANVIRGMYVDKENNIWISSWDHCVRRIKNDKVDKKICNEYTNLPGAIAVDLNGNLWIGTFKAGLSILLKDGSFRRIEGLPSEKIKFILVENSEIVWVGSLSGVYKTKNMQIVDYYPTEQMGGVVYDATIDNEGNIWFAVNGFGIKKLSKDGVFKAYKKEDGLVSNDVMCIDYDKERNIIWVGTKEGLSKFILKIKPEPTEKIKVYPNPCVLNKHKEIKFYGPNISEIRIYTLRGKLIKEIKKQPFAWSNINVSSGVYIFVIKNQAGEKITGKLAIIK